jgi:hypothetical protein
MQEAKVYEVFKVKDAVPPFKTKAVHQPSRQLVMDGATLDRLLGGKSSAARKFLQRRLKLLYDRCSKDTREGRIPVEAVNRLSTFCLEIIPLIESGKIVRPTAVELSTLFNWYLDMQKRSRENQEPAVVLSTVCPDYPFEFKGNKAVFTDGLVGDGIGLIGESIMNAAPLLLQKLSESLNMPITWLVGYAGFEAKPSNLDRMNLSAAQFMQRLETSAAKLQEKLGVPVGILPDMADITLEQFNDTRDGFNKEDFSVKRKGMDALAEAVDARDWAGVFTMASRLNAIIVDGASVYMGRKAYGKAEEIIKPGNYTPRFYCMCNYMGFDS